MMRIQEKVILFSYWALIYIGGIQVVSARDNIARSGAAEQSSTLWYGRTERFYWNASLAIDGHKLGRNDLDTEPRCSGTDRQDSPSWRVDLHTEHLIGKIKVYGRLYNPGNLRGFEMYITSSASGPIPREDLVYEDSIAVEQYNSRRAIYNIVTSRRGRFVYIFGKDNSYLVLCEVEVYEVCPEFTHGDGENCSSCGNCTDNETCRRSDGICPNGCAPGFLPYMCTLECTNGNYGQNCGNKCGHCRNNDPCDKVNGSCLRCEPGYKGRRCDEECDDFSYGDRCQSNCGQCKDDIPCNHTTGACRSCKAGFYTLLCKTECQNGRYGENCNSRCGHCKGSEVCDKLDGHCSACSDGYTGARCKNACPQYRYGENCRNTCGNCRNKATCHPVTGLCYACANGYNNSDKFCKTECPDYTYGYQCSARCGHCKNNMACNKINGSCSLGCSIGYEGDRCNSECSGRKFGEDCRKICHCKNNASCNAKTGHCPDGLCDDGWGGYDCNTDLNLINRLRPQSITTSMSKPIYQGMNPTLAVDGNETPLPDSCHCCSVSMAANPWWKLDLHMMLPIKRLIFIGRSESGKYDQFKEFRIYLSNTSDIYGQPVYQHSPLWLWEPTDYIIPVPVNNNMARFIKIDREDNVLTVCEMKIYEGDCQIGRYGDGCGNECHCSDALKCDLINGTCQRSGCYSGWQGDACNKECPSGTFGVNCSSECHCNNSSQCNKESGNCGSSGCASGWIGHNCSEVCDEGLFGFNCSSPCRCRNNQTCDHVTGQCYDGLCEKGYQGLNCSLTCDLGLFGLDCSNECHCHQNIQCDHVTGACKDGLCSAGYQGVNCSLTCDDGYYGINCSEVCGNCANNLTCDRTTGHCASGCDEKHKGPKCKTEVSELRREEGGTPGTVPGILVGIAVLILLVVAVAVVIIRKKRNDGMLNKPASKIDKRQTQRGPGRENLENGVCETSLYQNAVQADVTDSEYYSFSPRLTDLKIYDLWDYINQNKASGVEHLYNEYQKLPRGLTCACEAAKRPENYNKNRYKDMYAYDHSRVVLCEKDESDSDYINACYINGYEKTKKFIAAQGPAKATINDFWKMIWQETVYTIVMLTNLTEMGNLKCVQYWPDRDRISYGSLTLVTKDTEEHTEYVVRNLELEKVENDPRTVKLYHFKAWPDKAVPDASWPLVKFWRAVSEYASNSGGPIVVHCSAGVGRTGTFIALDNLFHQAMAEGCLRPLQMVETLRRQRVNMVQTKDQYVFLHEAVAEAFYFGTSSVFVNQFEEWYNVMCGTDQNSGKRRLNMQYELLVKSLNSEQRPKDADVNAIYSNTAEDEQQNKMDGPCGEKGWSQIEIEAFNGKNCFIICITPTADDHDAFCQLMKQKHIKTVIAISESPETLIKDEDVKEFTVNWAPDQLTPQGMDDLIPALNNIQSWQPFLNDTQPILVHCRSELSRCIVVCILLGEIQRQTLDGAVNVLAATKKALGNNRATLVPNFEQYKFCHEVILELHRLSDVYANM